MTQTRNVIVDELVRNAYQRGRVHIEVKPGDIVTAQARDTALDLQHSSGVTQSATRLIGSTSIRLAESSDIIVVTAGRPRTPGMTRADLKTVNARIIRTVGELIANIAPNSVVIVVTNPVDEMTIEMLNATGFPRERIIGMAGTLDSARFRSALSQAAGVPIADVSAFTLGSHGDEMVPIASKATIRGLPLSEFLNEETVEACRQQTIASGAEVVALRKTGSATFAPAHAILELIEHMRGGAAGAVPASVRLNGEYGIEGTVVGVPCKLCMSGVAEIVEIPLADKELNALMNAAKAVRSRLDSN